MESATDMSYMTNITKLLHNENDINNFIDSNKANSSNSNTNTNSNKSNNPLLIAEWSSNTINIIVDTSGRANTATSSNNTTTNNNTLSSTTNNNTNTSNNNTRSYFIKTKKMKPLEFCIHHYTGPVIYTCDNWLYKNRDILTTACQEIMSNSNNILIANLFHCLDISTSNTNNSTSNTNNSTSNTNNTNIASNTTSDTTNSAICLGNPSNYINNNFPLSTCRSTNLSSSFPSTTTSSSTTVTTTANKNHITLGEKFCIQFDNLMSHIHITEV